MQLKIVIVGIFQLILLPVFASIAAVNAYYCDLASWKSKCALGRKENDSSVGFQFESCARLSLQEEVLQGEHANFTTNFKTMIDFNYTATPLVNLVGNILKCMINGTKDVEHNIHFFNMKHLRQFLKNRYCMWNFYKYACCLLFDLKLKSEKPTNRSTYQEEDIENKALTSPFSQEIKENCTDSTPILRNASVSPESSELNVTSADTFMDELYNWSRMSEKEFTRQIFPFIVLNMGTALRLLFLSLLLLRPESLEEVSKKCQARL
ncbi:hypothetical protein C0J52_06809 [Blattella germanica]|nr:hypothetical protein C0J52_06809 [Blattella germanica]